MTCMRARTSSNFGLIRPKAAELWPLKDVRNWFLLNILRMDGQNLTKFCIHIIINKIYIAILKRHFSQICNRVTALDRCQKLVFAQYLENGIDRIQPNFVYTLSWTRSRFVLVNCNFSQICNGVTAFDWCQNLSFVQYLENGWTEFNQILNTHYYWQDLGMLLL